MAKPNRVTHAYEGPLVLFTIGMRIHRPWRLDVVAPATLAMTGMIRELMANRAGVRSGDAEDIGFLGLRSTIEGISPTMLTYWRSTHDLYAYANEERRKHRSAWVDFYRYTKRASSVVTIWHETFSVPEGHHEAIYVGPKPFGLADIAGAVPVAQRGEHARARMRDLATG